MKIIEGNYYKRRDEEIYNRCCAMDNSYTCNFIDGVEWAEEHHGITGVDDDN